MQCKWTSYYPYLNKQSTQWIKKNDNPLCHYKTPKRKAKYVNQGKKETKYASTGCRKMDGKIFNSQLYDREYSM